MVRFRVMAWVAAAITFVAVAGWVWPATAVSLTSLSLEPTTALAGTTVTAIGGGFPGNDPDGLPSCALTLAPAFAEEQELPSNCALDGEGGLRAEFTVPDVAPGEYAVIARAANVDASALLTVQSGVIVPDVSGMTRDEVLAAIDEARLSDCESIEGEGIAVSQEPPRGTIVPEGTCLNVTLRELVPVPNLLGLTVDQARTAVEGVGLVFSGPPAATGTVVGQQPAAETLVPPGSTVTVTLSEEPQPVPVTVPDLRTKTVAEAQAAVATVGLFLRGGGSDPDRRVADQTPEAGSRVARGSTVTVTLAATPAVLVEVPNLVGMTVREADAALQRVGLVLQGAGANPDERVVDQLPAAGARVAEGSTVAVSLAITPAATPSSGVPLGAVVAAAVMLVVAAAASAARKPWKRRVIATRPLRLRPHPDTAAEVQMVSLDDQPLPGLRIEPYPDQNVDAVLTEVAR